MSSLCSPEMVVGWYHSHPGFGCWLSSVDVNTQQVRGFWKVLVMSAFFSDILLVPFPLLYQQPPTVI